jgi:hypothetical protein
MDILAQRQDFWVARPTLKALNQKQSLAAIHHCTLSGSCSIDEANGALVERLPKRKECEQHAKALATEAIAECIRSGSVWEAESSIELVGFVPAPTATDRDAPFTVKRVKF